MIHHDYDNAPYWGTPNTNHQNNEKEIINVVVDISNPVRTINELVNGHITEGEYCEELKREILKHTCKSLLAYAQQDFSPLGTSDENSFMAIQCLIDYQLPPVLASEIFHKVESSIIRALLNVVPEIDDERKYTIMEHKIISGNGLYLTLGVTND